MKVNDEQFHNATPILPVNDVKETVQFYKDKLGFSIDILWAHPNYACVSRGGVAIEFGEGRPEHVGSGVCYIHVKNVEEIYQLYKMPDLEFVGEMEDREYGSKDFRIRDNNGNLLIFGSPLHNKNALIAKHNLA